MAMTPLSRFVNHVLPHASGIPRAMVIDELRNAIIRLCEDSSIYREDIPPGTVSAGVDDYTITPPTDTRVTTFISFQYDGSPINGYTEEALDRLDRNWRLGKEGTPTAYTMLAPDRFKLNRIPELEIIDGMIIRIALKPTETTTEVDEVFYDDWQQAAISGALANLLAMPKKPWTDMRLAKENGAIFNGEVQRARARANSGYHRGGPSVQMRPWA